MQPFVDHFVAAEGCIERRRGLACPKKWRNQHFVELFGCECLGHALCLVMAKFGERRILHVQVVAHPLGLTMTDEDEFHTLRLYAAAPAGFERITGIACAG